MKLWNNIKKILFWFAIVEMLISLSGYIADWLNFKEITEMWKGIFLAGIVFGIIIIALYWIVDLVMKLRDLRSKLKVQDESHNKTIKELSERLEMQEKKLVAFNETQSIFWENDSLNKRMIQGYILPIIHEDYKNDFIKYFSKLSVLHEFKPNELELYFGKGHKFVKDYLIQMNLRTNEELENEKG